MIRDKEVIKKTLEHLGLWEVNSRPEPKASEPTKIAEYSLGYSVPQLPRPLTCRKASRSNERVYVDPEYPEVFLVRFFQFEGKFRENV